MIGIGSFIALSLRARLVRVLGLIAFGAVFLVAAATTRFVTGGGHGHVELDRLFQLGGSTLVSALLLIGWLAGRFPIIAVLVLMSGVFSADRAAGHARLYAVRPRSMLLLYGARALVLMLLAFALSAIIMPAFDLLLLGRWPGTGLLAMIGAQVVVYGSLTALLSTIGRGDAWTALFVGIVGIIWDALRRADFFQQSVHVVRDAVSVVLPPQGALMRVETAFASFEPVPWDAMLYIATWATLAFIVAAVVLSRREL